jgi:hypothetical protein
VPAAKRLPKEDSLVAPGREKAKEPVRTAAGHIEEAKAAHGPEEEAKVAPGPEEEAKEPARIVTEPELAQQAAAALAPKPQSKSEATKDQHRAKGKFAKAEKKPISECLREIRDGLANEGYWNLLAIARILGRKKRWMEQQMPVEITALAISPLQRESLWATAIALAIISIYWPRLDAVKIWQARADIWLLNQNQSSRRDFFVDLAINWLHITQFGDKNYFN